MVKLKMEKRRIGSICFQRCEDFFMCPLDISTLPTEELEVQELPVSEKCSDYDFIAQVAKALAHPTRLFILELVARERICVQDIVDKTPYDQSTISKHLSILSSIGIVSYEKEGQKIYYSIKHPCIMNFFTCARVFLDEETSSKQNMLNYCLR